MGRLQWRQAEEAASGRAATPPASFRQCPFPHLWQTAFRCRGKQAHRLEAAGGGEAGTADIDLGRPPPTATGLSIPWDGVRGLRPAPPPPLLPGLGLFFALRAARKLSTEGGGAGAPPAEEPLRLGAQSGGGGILPDPPNPALAFLAGRPPAASAARTADTADPTAAAAPLSGPLRSKG